ncbi:MAG: hypothetical protein ABJB47_20055 [Actinomycetota bacterium]
MMTSAQVQQPPAGGCPRPSAPASAPARADRAVWLTVLFGCAAMLVSYLPFSAVNGVLATIGVSAGASTGDLQWVTGAFTVALVGAVLSAGVIGDLYGRRHVALAGLGLTVVSTLAGFAAGGLAGRAAVHLLRTSRPA